MIANMAVITIRIAIRPTDLSMFPFLVFHMILNNLERPDFLVSHRSFVRLSVDVYCVLVSLHELLFSYLSSSKDFPAERFGVTSSGVGLHRWHDMIHCYILHTSNIFETLQRLLTFSVV